ncbi:MAG: ABC transporter ATP-binding protein [Mobilitalea sp.]
MPKKIRILIYFFQMVHKLCRFYILKYFIYAMFKSFTPFFNIILPKFIIDELMGKQRLNYIVLYVLLLVIGNFLLKVINQYLSKIIEIASEDFANKLDAHLGKKCAEMDYENIENTEILDLKENVFFSLYNQNAIGRTFENSSTIISEIIKLFGLGYLLTVLNPLILVVILGIVFFNSTIFKKIERLRDEDNQKSITDNRAFSYFLRLTSDFTYGKDIRLYQAAPFLLKRLWHYMDNLYRIYSKQNTLIGKYMGISKVNIQLQVVIIYGYLAYQVIKNKISLGSLTMYASAAGSFGASVMSLINAFIEVNQLCSYLELFVRFEEIPTGDTKGIPDPIQTADYTIEFKNVSFRYPGSNIDTLKNVSIIIPPAQKLSIVGLNGAGKTTFIKLLFKLYEPTEGQILLGGIDIKEYTPEEYRKNISVVFQDFKLLAYTIRENITLDQAAEENRIISNLEKAGFSEDLDKFENNINTIIYKGFDKDGVELSGGQAQKIAIARALYKDAPIVILDEPTAALDPISEYEVFNSFNQLIYGKTAIYISHRLSSTRFSDKIAVFHDGTISEYGTHSNLLLNNSLYAQMFQTQAKYYTN